MNSERQDIYEKITENIIAAIERGATAARMPWHRKAGDTFSPVNVVSKRSYRGVNVIMLWGTADAQGYETGYWGTYNQWQEIGAQVKKGEKSTPVVFWKFSDSSAAESEEHTEEDSETPKRRGAILARGYHVFNAAQVEGFTMPAETGKEKFDRIAEAETFFANLGADIRQGGDRAYYSPKTDHIQMPRFDSFIDAESYYSVLGHECCHWVGGSSRLNRELGPRFGEEAYAAEELIAELGAAFLCAELGLSNEPRPDHAGYLASWLTVLKNDKRAIFTAASKAQAAVNWMKERQTAPMQKAA